MDLDILRKIHFRAKDDPEWCNCNLPWPCPVLAVYRGRSLPIVALLPLKVCRHFHAVDSTVLSDQAQRITCLTCGAEWSDLPRFTEG